MGHPLTDLLEKYSKKELQEIARKEGINPAGRTKWWLLSTLVQKNIIDIGYLNKGKHA